MQMPFRLAAALVASALAACVPLTDEALPTDPLLLDSDGDGFTREDGDCDDSATEIYPGATEVCDGVDNNCSGTADDAFDSDGDGYSTCEEVSGFIDCNDSNEDAYPGAAEVCDGVDNNCNNQIDERLDSDNDGFSGCEYADDVDCNDDDNDIHPGATELCDGVDNDCDEEVDEEFDRDGDGYVSAACTIGGGETDCDDTNASVAPGETEVCDGVDNNCDTRIDEGFDGDSDGYFSCVSADGEGEIIPEDCDDTDGALNPGAQEVCDSVDNDCDELTDDADDSVQGQSTYYTDDDGDGYGDVSAPVLGCVQPDGAVSDATDCDDTSAAINPDTVWYFDGDGDSYGTGSGQQQCPSPGEDYVLVSGDCSDSKASVNPGATELCNGADEDCDSGIDEGILDVDSDGDGYVACDGELGTVDCDDQDILINPGADEECDELDNDCDSSFDESFDLDGDGISTCAFVDATVDCDDTDATVYPGATETCDGVDENCTGGSGDVYVSADTAPRRDYSSIDAALQGTPSGCTVVVAAGTYNERIDYRGKAIRLVSESGPATTIIDGDMGFEDPGITVTFDTREGEGATLEGFTITGDNGDTSLQDTSVEGGGIYVGDEASPRIIGNRIVNNTADNGAGLYCLDCGVVWLEGNTFEGNIAYRYVVVQVHSNGDGAAIYAVNGNLISMHNTFSSNVAQRYGGGVYLSGGAFNSTDDIFVGNSAIHGGGLSAHGSSVSIANASFTLNTAGGIEGPGFSTELADGQGGGLVTVGGFVTIRNSLIDRNRSTGSSIGLGIGGGWRSLGCTASLYQSVVVDNFTSESGGAVYLSGGGFDFSNNLFAYNSAGLGAAMVVDLATSLLIANNTLFENETLVGGGTIYVAASNGPIFNNLVIGDPGFYGYYYDEESPQGDVVAHDPSQLTYNNFFGNPLGGYGGFATDLTGVQGNIAADPLFEDPESSDFSLAEGSPSIDTGDPNADLMDTDGSRGDMGIFGGPRGNWSPDDVGATR